MDSGLRFWFLSGHEVLTQRTRKDDGGKGPSHRRDKDSWTIQGLYLKKASGIELIEDIALAEVTGRNTTANSNQQIADNQGFIPSA